MTTEKLGFTVTPAKMAFALSLIAVASAVSAGGSTFMEMRFRMSALEKFQTEQIETNKAISDKIDRLSDSLIAFNLTLKEIQVRQDGLK